MNNVILNAIENKGDYMAVLEAVTGMKKQFTDEETNKLLKIYEDNADRSFGLQDKKAVRTILVLDTADMGVENPMSSAPLAALLNKVDLDALDSLIALYRADQKQKPELAMQMKDMILIKDAVQTNGMTNWLALSMARAALDILAGQRDITLYREDIKWLVEFLKQADENEFHDASCFLPRVIEHLK